MKRCFLLLTIAVTLIPFTVKSQKFERTSPDFELTKSKGQPRSTLININNISMWIRNDGWSARNPHTGNGGVIFPQGTGTLIFQDGIVWAGLIKDSRQPILRAGGQTYGIGTLEGRIISKGVAEDPNDPDVRIWRIRRDWKTANLRQDAAELNNISVEQVTEAQIAEVREQYERDWNKWPWEKGAPFYDDNDNGIMDPGEEPGLAHADQVIWFVANDLSVSATKGSFGSLPIGLEFQGTLWAYKKPDPLENAIFKRYRLIYKGTETTPDTAHIDSMYIGQWSDPDVGSYSDDLVGTDTLLALGYAYNSAAMDQEYSRFALIPPAMGYNLLRGPLDAHSEPLGMTSFVSIAPFFGDPCLICDRSAEHYNLLRGFPRDSDPQNPEPHRDPNGNPTKFMFSGDPVTGSGWLDGHSRPPGDRRFVMGSGPFTMALGDTQEVIIAVVAGLGANRLFSVQVMKHHAKWARQLALANFELPPESEPEPEKPPLPTRFRLSQNFPNPFNPGTKIRYELPEARHVNLSIYNVLGQNFKTLVDEVKAAGSYSVTWDGTDERGQPVPSGVYFYRFDAEIVSGTKKMILMR
ncbi:T9SS type A sorting domain-containing protein [candidate division KSB1 bacterium]|nr:T9SS type A sorting domain-containing protein [candidate division KSB1 bacterium]